MENDSNAGLNRPEAERSDAERPATERPKEYFSVRLTLSGAVSYTHLTLPTSDLV